MIDHNAIALSLARDALAAAPSRGQAVTALMTAASAILTADLGGSVAAQLMVEMATSAQAAVAASGIVAETTRH